MELGGAPGPEGTDDHASTPTTPLPVLGRAMSNELRGMSPLTLPGDDREGEGVELNDSASSDGRAPTPIAARTAARQLRVHMSGLGIGEIRRGNASAHTRALNQQSAAEFVSVIEIAAHASL